ncbi:hypothetical protein QFZ79_004393 [Arthrobacter sp. V4I6]|uniref:winged helix DNA-binding domain-containing protein n=1 Tax=unclassified Arthrobacter TaxID=235627 RepID=UPI002785BED1|nr:MULTISPECIES: winged helix DNA-binding domain-containing protein [unclassified Arthrobacter]MDQ0822013.1 hypothetical protein [Arthrobacter sp. V1I7]MDQ0856282.1 hypothetical protein [Arthrobacter sp. V4I6]
MDADDVVRLRLRRQQLREPFAATAEDALQNLLAVQSQEFPYARWSLAQRTVGGSAAGIEQAVSEGTVLRTHILRPTWHFVHRDDLRWLLALSAPRLHQGNAGMYRRTGIDAANATRSSDVLAGAVAGGAHKTREQLAAELRRAGFGAEGLELAYRIMFAEAGGVLVSGSPVRSAGGALKQTYALFDERVPSAPAGLMDRTRALAELARRYFTSRGPATEKDCADWSGLTRSDVRTGLHLARETAPGALETATVDGVACYFSPAPDAGGGASGPGRLDLIQCYDEYVMGYWKTRHFLGGPAPFVPVAGEPLHLVLRNGRLAGAWRHNLVRGRCELDIRLDSDHHPDDEHEISRAVAAYGRFLGMPAVRL